MANQDAESESRSSLFCLYLFFCSRLLQVYIYTSIKKYIYIYTQLYNMSLSVSISESLYLPPSLCVCPSACIYLRVSLSVSHSLSLYLSLRLCGCPGVRPSSFRVPICLPNVFQSESVYVIYASVRLSLYQHHYLPIYLPLTLIQPYVSLYNLPQVSV